MSKLIRLIIFAVFIFSTPAAFAAAEIGQPAPALTGIQLDGKSFDLSALKGKVVIVHFWATWCPACREEMPELEALYRKNHGMGLEVLAVSADRPRAIKDVKEVMHYFSYPAAMMSDLKKNDFDTPKELPITYIIDTNGVVNSILTPETQPLTEAGLSETIKSLLPKTDKH